MRLSEIPTLLTAIIRGRSPVSRCLAVLVAGAAACGGSNTPTSAGGGGVPLLILIMQPIRIGTIGTCNQFQLWVDVTDATGNPVVADSTLWSSSDASAISVSSTGLLTSYHASPAVTITVKAWKGASSGAATGLWGADLNAVLILDKNGNPYPEPPCP